ncbi:single-stranded DNA-binding protein [Microbacterium horticulturae]|uniref:Single-stranded DNA-binding protein n=1 Tax=Microbacterium horticulturae TaxID=3028316 RepID=A0ABY8C637_9MICO|nr:single-stranded DNA-binding protein [Microbacterium sp. KACC 23027]WEG10288.1 single-stranded DNA-binding protein [Microbacterium sp. KACC 23027]
MNDTITIMGNLAADPEKRMIGGGMTVTSFRVASTQRHFDRKEGKWVDKDTNWYDVSVFRDLGDHAYESLRKGERVIVNGRLKIRPWQTEKAKGTSVEIEAEAVGHDLLWGTTKYTRVRRGDEWNVPGMDAATADGADGAAGTDPSGAAGDGVVQEWTTAPLGQGEGAPGAGTAQEAGAPVLEGAPF